jgi:hypothetical protein
VEGDWGRLGVADMRWWGRVCCLVDLWLSAWPVGWVGLQCAAYSLSASLYNRVICHLQAAVYLLCARQYPSEACVAVWMPLCALGASYEAPYNPQLPGFKPIF